MVLACTIMMAVGTTTLGGGSGFQDHFKTYIATLEGPGFSIAIKVGYYALQLPPIN